MRGRRASPSRARRAAASSRRAPASARPPPSPSPHRYRPKAAKKTYANQLPTHTKGQASQLVKQVRRHQRRNTPPDAGSYFRRRRRRVFDWINNVAKWTSDGPEEREDGSQRVLRHYRRNHLSLETLSAPLPLGETSKQLQQALSEATYAPYQTRVDAFQKAMDSTRVSWEVGRVELRIRRHHCLVDAAKALENLPSHKWREPWYVTFANESALDAGGPSREFFRLVSKDLASSGLFSIAHDESYALKADAVLNDKFPRAHEMLLLAGRLCGKALLEGHHLEHLRLNPILLKHVVAEPLSLKDLALLDGDLARGLDALLHMDPDDVPSLCLTWSVSDDLDVDDKKWTRDLVPNGSEIPVAGRAEIEFWAPRGRRRREVDFHAGHRQRRAELRRRAVPRRVLREER